MVTIPVPAPGVVIHQLVLIQDNGADEIDLEFIPPILHDAGSPPPSLPSPPYFERIDDDLMAGLSGVDGVLEYWALNDE
jgi:hypothetical protein